MTRGPTNADIINMLNCIGYVRTNGNLGAIIRKGMRKEWSYLCDAFIKVFLAK